MRLHRHDGVARLRRPSIVVALSCRPAILAVHELDIAFVQGMDAAGRGHRGRRGARTDASAAAGCRACGRQAQGPHRVDLRPPPRHARLPGRGRCSTSCSSDRVRHAVPGRRHRRRLAAAAQWYWPQAHNDVVQKLLRKARKGTRVIFVPGNHDEFARTLPRPRLRRHRGRRRLDPRHRRRPAAVGHARRPVRRRDPVRQVAGLRRRLGSTSSRCSSTATSTRCARGSACRTGACRST